MSRYAFVTLDVFTDRRFTGNPLAVFPQAEGLDNATMRALAMEFNLSETTFVLPPDDAANTAHVRIFTPQTEVEFAGHPNVGTAWVLARQGLDRDGVLRFEGAGGLVEVRAERNDGQLVSCNVVAPKPLTLSEAPGASELSACASLSAGEILSTDVASVGLECVFAEVKESSLADAAPNTDAFRALARRWLGSHGRFPICLYARDGNRLRSRVFGPLYGVVEDPACGSATCALVAMLLQRDGLARNRMTMSMGQEMGRPSVIECGADRSADGSIRAWVGGSCVEVLRGEIEI